MTKKYMLTPALFLISILSLSAQVKISGTVERAYSLFSCPKFVEAEINLTGDINLSTNASSSKYVLNSIPSGSNVELSAKYPDNNLNPFTGINTLDLVYIQNHITGKKKITNPYKLLAADFNQDKNISTGDLTLMRQSILHIINTYPFGDIWKYVVVKVVDPNDPTKDIISKTIKFTNLQSDQIANFLAYKLGDISGDGCAIGIEHEVRSNENFELLAENKSFVKGDVLEMIVSARDISSAQACQFTLNFNTAKLGFMGVEGLQESITSDNFSCGNKCSGNITGSIILPQESTNNQLFKVSLRAREDGELKDAVSLNSDMTLAEAYNNNDEAIGLNLIFKEEKKNILPDQPILYQNEPNPFFTNTIISFELPNNDEALLSIFNADGKLVKRIDQTFSKGINNITLDANDFATSGLYFYQLKTKDFVGTKKMMVIR